MCSLTLSFTQTLPWWSQFRIPETNEKKSNPSIRCVYTFSALNIEIKSTSKIKQFRHAKCFHTFLFTMNRYETEIIVTYVTYIKLIKSLYVYCFCSISTKVIFIFSLSYHYHYCEMILFSKLLTLLLMIFWYQSKYTSSIRNVSSFLLKYILLLVSHISIYLIICRWIIYQVE